MCSWCMLVLILFTLGNILYSALAQCSHLGTNRHLVAMHWIKGQVRFFTSTSRYSSEYERWNILDTQNSFGHWRCDCTSAMGEGRLWTSSTCLCVLPSRYLFSKYAWMCANCNCVSLSTFYDFSTFEGRWSGISSCWTTVVSDLTLQQFRQALKTYLFGWLRLRRLVSFCLYCAMQMVLLSYLLTCQQ